MSRYGTFPYTSGILYGPTGSALFRVANFTAISKQYGSISLSWVNPVGTWNRLRLVRSSYGFPAHPGDGTVLFDSNSGTGAYGTRTSPINAFEDDGHLDGLRLTPGQTYYYTLFVQYSQGSEFRWARGGDAQAIAVSDHGYLDFLLRRLPSIYTTVEMQSDGQPSQQSSTMSRFMSLFAFDLSRYRDTLESLKDVNDPDTTNGVLLPSMGNQLAYRYEPEIGMRQNRVLMRNATFLAQRKGTSLGVSGLVSSVTGYGVNVSALRNLLHDDNDSNGETTIGRWVGTSSTLDLSTAVAAPSDSLYTDTPNLLRVTSTGTSCAADLYAADPVGLGIPVTAGDAYTLSMYLQSDATSRMPTILIRWFDENAVFLASTSAVTAATSTSAWARATVTGTAPAGAMYATVRVSYTTSVSGEVQYVKAVQLEQSSTATDYRPAREVVIDLIAPRVNEVTNPSFDLDASGWAVTGVGSGARDATVAREGGLASFEITPSGTGSVTASFDGVVCDPSAPYVWSAYVRVSGAQVDDARATVDFYDAGAVQVGSGTGAATVVPVGPDWVRVSVEGRTPATAVAAHVHVVVADATTAKTIWIDDTLFEHNDLLADYFDKRVEPQGAYLESDAVAYPARTHFYPLYPFRYARAKKLVEDSVLLGTTVTFQRALPR